MMQHKCEKQSCKLCNQEIKPLGTFEITYKVDKFQCCWSEIIDGILVQCKSWDTKLDKDNVNLRYFCEKDMEQVKNARAKMHKDCIDKNLLIKGINGYMKLDIDHNTKITLLSLLKLIEQGSFK